MKVLALDTSMDASSVALYDAAAGAVLAEAHQVLGRGHAEIVFRQIADVLAAAGATHADIDRYGVTVGPGSFTGVRVGLAAARGLALAAGKPLVGIGTLEAIAAAVPVPPEERLVIAVDARRGELYVQAFDGGGPAGEALVADPATAALRTAPPGGMAAVVAGSGAEILIAALAVRGVVARPVAADQWPRARHVARLASRRDDPGDLRPGPLYLRAPDAKLPGA